MLSGWSVFLSPMTGIVVSDYFFVRGRQYHVGDLYVGNPSSAYWYTAGFNFRGFLAWIVGMAPLLPGFARAIQGTSSGNGWDHIYQISYFYGFFATLTVYALLYVAFPQERQHGTSPFVLAMHAEMLEGVEEDSRSGSGSGSGFAKGEDEEKGGVGVDGRGAAKTFAA